MSTLLWFSKTCAGPLHIGWNEFINSFLEVDFCQVMGGEIMKGPGCLGEFGSQGLLYWKGRERRGPHNETEGICLLHNFPRGQLCIWFLSYFLSFFE